MKRKDKPIEMRVVPDDVFDERGAIRPGVQGVYRGGEVISTVERLSEVRNDPDFISAWHIRPNLVKK